MDSWLDVLMMIDLCIYVNLKDLGGLKTQCI
jgi:hypothetical protein